jgi:hypothetical protein
MLYDNRPLYRRSDNPPSSGEGFWLELVIVWLGPILLFIMMIVLGYDVPFHLRDDGVTEASVFLAP